MAKKSFFVAMLGMALALLITACDGFTTDGMSDLRGTWERTEAAWWYTPESGYQSLKGKLVITYNSVTITGPVAHLQGFTQDIALEARAEDGLLYIKDTGEWKTPIPYRRWQSAGYADTLITLTGGSIADETLKQIGN
ncbi:MAG: hypothetical protein LBS64_00995 [Spirochaetaceae bacterium]|jgi:hypothetical protein|nr:hypothetical protein [Spirochaetaceae bacterium]